MQPKYCLYGAGGHGRVVASQLKATYDCAIYFADSNINLQQKYVDNVLVKYRSLDSSMQYHVLVTIGNNMLRRGIQTAFPHLIADPFLSGNSIVYNSKIGKGTQVLDGAVVNTGTVIGSGVIVNTGAVVEHDCSIGDYCHLAPSCTLAGSVFLHPNVFVGAGAVILPGLTIAENTVIGAGAVVTSDINEPGTWIGVPAKMLSLTKKKI